MQGPRNFRTAQRRIQGIEAVQMLRKEQILGAIRTNLATVSIAFALLFGMHNPPDLTAVVGKISPITFATLPDAVPSCGYPRFLRLGRFFFSVLSVSGGAGAGCGFGTGSGFRRNGSLGCGFFSGIS
jgi:hypothetical protein